MSMAPIGTIRSPYTSTAEIPKGQGATHEAEGVLELLPELETGLTDIEGFSHLYVIWVFDRAEGYDLLATPPTDSRPHGVTRSPCPTLWIVTAPNRFNTATSTRERSCASRRVALPQTDIRAA